MTEESKSKPKTIYKAKVLRGEKGKLYQPGDEMDLSHLNNDEKGLLIAKGIVTVANPSSALKAAIARHT